MVPSDRAKGAPTAPMSALAAIPLILPECSNLTTLGIIDTGATACCISEKLFKDPRFNSRAITGNLMIRGPKGESKVPTVRMDLIIATAAFEPWLRLQQIPFVVLHGDLWNVGTAGILLGYSGCLEHLNVQLDFPKRIISISAPASLDVNQSNEVRIIESSRLKEAELAITNGAFDSAIIMAVAAIEDFMQGHLALSADDSRLSPLSRITRLMPVELQQKFTALWQLRNQAVHGGAKSALGKKDAENVIRDSRRILLQLSKQLPRAGTAFPAAVQPEGHSEKGAPIQPLLTPLGHATVTPMPVEPLPLLIREWPGPDSLAPEEKKVLRTLWREQNRFIAEGRKEYWGFVIGPNASDYGDFVRGFSSLAQRRLLTQGAKGIVFLTKSGIEYCKVNAQRFDMNGEAWTQFLPV
jgi:hypothetical protein